MLIPLRAATLDCFPTRGPPSTGASQSCRDRCKPWWKRELEPSNGNIISPFLTIVPATVCNACCLACVRDWLAPRTEDATDLGTQFLQVGDSRHSSLIKCHTKKASKSATLNPTPQSLQSLHQPKGSMCCRIPMRGQSNDIGTTSNPRSVLYAYMDPLGNSPPRSHELWPSGTGMPSTELHPSGLLGWKYGQVVWEYTLGSLYILQMLSNPKNQINERPTTTGSRKQERADNRDPWVGPCRKRVLQRSACMVRSWEGKEPPPEGGDQCHHLWLPKFQTLKSQTYALNFIAPNAQIFEQCSRERVGL